MTPTTCLRRLPRLIEDNTFKGRTGLWADLGRAGLGVIATTAIALFGLTCVYILMRTGLLLFEMGKATLASGEKAYADNRNALLVLVAVLVD